MYINLDFLAYVHVLKDGLAVVQGLNLIVSPRSPAPCVVLALGPCSRCVCQDLLPRRFGPSADVTLQEDSEKSMRPM